ncbi:MAG: S1/P1 nuclease [Gammaproteobacteria bacterium]|nr:S1/P1 nuclease [Gammaproteobacteria bacterium]
MNKIIFILFLFFSSAIFAWNGSGHRVIAQIAYDQLTPSAKEKIDALTEIRFKSKYPDERFLKASTWPDQIRKTSPQYSAWHFIDLPFVKDNIKTAALNAQNVATEITEAEKIVADKSEKNNRRAKYLSFLIHFLGDIHQPLHCTTLYDTTFPQGDEGGNRFQIKTAISDNLHQYWDEGLGLFYSAPGHYHFYYYQVETLAKQLMAEYPKSFFGARLGVMSPMQWAQESHQLAVTSVYQIQPNAVPTDAYIAQGQTVVREQVVLSGDRLAMVLNNLFK